MTREPATARRSPAAWETVLVGGHESHDGRAIGGLRGARVTAVGRELYALTRRPAVVVPMTFGRDAELASQIAQVLRWNGRGREPGELLLAPPLGTTAHLVGWLRAAAGRPAVPDSPAPSVTGSTIESTGGPARDPTAAGPWAVLAVLVAAPSASAQEDAELYRVAHLVRRNSGLRWVEVALMGGQPDVAEAVARCHLLGARHVRVVPASFVRPDLPEGVSWAGPLLAPAALRELVGRRVETARDRWTRYADDGLAAVSAGHHHHDHSH
ncbi:hypothetical protein AB0395_09265 [Streptosporangium sp. NPDC051023]|uniref:hypothetical protein n=1 Tax=Streptosporangium sp. NPDC051023 TaxID=3155410 RepID=UPI00344DE91B